MLSARCALQSLKCARARRGEIRLCALLPARHGHLASAAPTLVLPTEGFERVPREYGDMCAHHLPWTTRRFDAAVLARRTQQRYARIFPRVRVWQGTPERVSFWMAAHLPIDSREKQDLLELPTLCARLHQVRARPASSTVQTALSGPY